MKPSAKPRPPVTAAKRLGLTVAEVEVLGFLAFLPAGPENNPLESLESLAATWRELVAEICPPPTPRAAS
jgi:hypothetical protein